jgi:hypothetical protein
MCVRGLKALWSIVDLGLGFGVYFCQLILISHRLQIFPVVLTVLCLACCLECWRDFSGFLLHSGFGVLHHKGYFVLSVEIDAPLLQRWN